MISQDCLSLKSTNYEADFICINGGSELSLLSTKTLYLIHLFLFTVSLIIGGTSVEVLDYWLVYIQLVKTIVNRLSPYKIRNPCISLLTLESHIESNKDSLSQFWLRLEFSFTHSLWKTYFYILYIRRVNSSPQVHTTLSITTSSLLLVTDLIIRGS